MNEKWDGNLVMSTHGGPIIEMSLGEYLARKDAEIERLRAALIEWDALIQHQYSGSRDAMTDMQRAALNTKLILDKLDALDGLEAKP